MEGWKVTQEGLSQLIPLLRESQNPSSDQQAVQKAFVEMSRHPDYFEYLLYVFVEMKEENLGSRAAAGVLLRKSIKGQFSEIPERTKDLIRRRILLTLDDSNQLIRSTTASISTTFISHSGFLSWPSLLSDLEQMMNHPNSNVVLGAFETMLLLCEDHSYALDSQELNRPLNVLIPKFLSAFHSPVDQIRKYALSCMAQFLVPSPNALNLNMSNYIQGLLYLHNDPSIEVRKEVCRGLVVITEIKTEHLEQCMKDVVKYMIATMQHPEESLAIEAAEFWPAIATTNICRESVEEFLPQILPVLLDKMVYSDDDIIFLTVEDDDSVEDDPKDVKPFLYSSKHTTKDEDDDDGEVVEWSLRKTSALGLDNLSEVFEDRLLPFLLPVLQARLSDQNNWKARESAVLVLGAIAQGCENGMKEHLSALIPYIISLLNDSNVLVASISSWTISRYSPWICGDEAIFNQVVKGLLIKMLDRNKKVQESACSAFATLSEEAREYMVAFIEPAVQTFVTAFSRYRAKNTFHLYDAIGSFAQAVGPDLNQPIVIQHLLPILLHRFNACQDEDPHLLPILECLVSVVTSLRSGFQPFILPVFQRCLRLIELALITQQHNSAQFLGIDLLICSLDLVCGMVDGLRSGIEGLIGNSNLILLLLQILKDKLPPDVVQSCFALIGDMAKSCISYLRPHLPLLFSHLTAHLANPEFISVCNNASWAIGEISIRVSREELLPFHSSVLQILVQLINKEKLNKYLKENVAITIGRVATALPAETAAGMPHFMQNWCSVLRNLRDAESKESSVKGLCMIVAANPGAAAHYLNLIITVFVSVDGQKRKTTEEVKQMMVQILHGYKSHSLQHWQSLVSKLPNPTQEKLATMFGV